MRRLRWDIVSACAAAAVIIGASAAHMSAGALNGGAVVEGNQPSVQFTPSDLRGSFPELPPKRSTPRTSPRGPSMRFAAMDLLTSGG